MKPILVIGGCNMDVLGLPRETMRLRDSLQGRVVLRPGGVGRNIAHALGQIGMPVELMAVIGRDAFGEQLRQQCLAAGIGLDYALRTARGSCLYMAIHDAQGDMLAAVNDMASMDELKPEHIGLLPQDIFSCCILDANLSEEVLRAAAEHLRCPLVADPVSCEKAPRLRGILRRIMALKPNLQEAQALTGQNNAQDAAAALLDRGVRQVYLSMGAAGLYYASAEEAGLLMPPKVSTAAATGAGDAMTAGIARAVASGLPVKETARLGMEAAARFLSRQEEEKTT